MMRAIKILIISCFSIISILPKFSTAQENDQDGYIQDTSIKIKTHSPKLAAWMSAAIPGLGQCYNKKYWKLPIIYGGLGVCGYYVYHNTSMYRKYKESYLSRSGVDSTAIDYFPSLSLNSISDLKEAHHKNIEVSYIAASLLYLLNIIDATVDAHLYDFDVSSDLSLRIEPSIIPYNSFGSVSGMKITLKF